MAKAERVPKAPKETPVGASTSQQSKAIIESAKELDQASGKPLNDKPDEKGARLQKRILLVNDLGFVHVSGEENKPGRFIYSDKLPEFNLPGMQDLEISEFSMDEDSEEDFRDKIEAIKNKMIEILAPEEPKGLPVQPLIDRGFIFNPEKNAFENLAVPDPEKFVILQDFIESATPEKFKSLLIEIDEYLKGFDSQSITEEVKENRIQILKDLGFVFNEERVSFENKAFSDPINKGVPKFAVDSASDEEFGNLITNISAYIKALKDASTDLGSDNNSVNEDTKEFPVYPMDDPADARKNHEERSAKFGESYVVTLKGNIQRVWTKQAWEQIQGSTSWKLAPTMPEEVLEIWRNKNQK